VENSPLITQHFVLGFMFSADLTEVALIKKERPQWQAGKLNGIGGKVEEHEPWYMAMVREFQEEAGKKTPFDLWKPFGQMTGYAWAGDGETIQTERWAVHLFAATGDLTELKTTTDEAIIIVAAEWVTMRRDIIIDELPWLVPMAQAFLRDGKPKFASISYA
jgi:8-oxo-dGTP pyrophosphatase MutT (NUDIX family)